MWHRSTLQHVIDDVKDYSNVMSLLATMFFEANVDVLGIAGLAKLLSMPDGKRKIQERFGIAATVKSANRMLVIDSEDKYEKKGNTFSGLAAIGDLFVRNVSGAANTPTSRLFGEQAQGLGSEGKGDDKNYKKFLRSLQSRYTPGLEYLYTIAAIDMFGSVPPGWQLSWNTLEQESGAEKAQRQLNEAQRDKIYVGMGAVSALVIARQLKEDNVYPMMEQEDVDEVEESLEAGDPEESAELLTMGQDIPKPGVGNPPTKGKPVARKPAEGEEEEGEDVPAPKEEEVARGASKKGTKAAESDET
jgi:hypothetical protein